MLVAPDWTHISGRNMDTMSPGKTLVLLVGETGFEPATSWTRTTRSTRLSYTPMSDAKSILAGNCELRQFTQAFFESTFGKGRQGRKRLIRLALSEARSVRKPP
jgi:hypothetical protein